MEDKMYQKIAKWFPFKKLRYFIIIDELAKATTGKYGNTVPSSVTVFDLLDRNYNKDFK